MGAWVLTEVWSYRRSAVAAVFSDHTRPASPLDPFRPAPSFDAPRAAPVTSAAARVIATLERVERRARVSSYRHRRSVDERRGVYHWDCSGMASWVLRRSAPRARGSLGQGRVVARRFARRISRAPTERGRRGWQRLEHIGEARPGDVFAWERPPDFPSRNTGHVGFVVRRPQRLSDEVWAVRILDATSLAHQSDTRLDGATGLGRGTMTFVTDGRGHAQGYGWRGTDSLGYIETPVYFGRVH